MLPKGYRYLFPKPQNVFLCRPCHTIVHQLRTNLELALFYNTREKVIKLLQENTMPIEIENKTVIIPMRQHDLSMTGT